MVVAHYDSFVTFFFSYFYVSVCLSSSCGVFLKDTAGEIISAIILAFVDFCCNSDLDCQTSIYTLLHYKAPDRHSFQAISMEVK